MSNCVRFLVGICATVLIFGCVSAMLVLGPRERRYGISRAVVLSSFPDFGCIRQALERVHEIRKIDYIGPPERTELQQLRYEGEGFWAHIAVIRKEGQARFVHDRLTVDKKPSANELRETHRMMMIVEQRLASECAMKELITGVKERWENVPRSVP